jgi:repressor LexA
VTTAITSRQGEVERFIRDYHKTKGYGPSVRDVAAWMGISVNGASGHLKALRGKGRITWDEKTPRSLRIVDKHQPCESPSMN